MNTYDWADNSAKLQRALLQVGPEGSEQEIKNAYILMGGKVLENDHTSNTESNTNTPEEQPVNPRPKRTYKRRP